MNKFTPYVFSFILLTFTIPALSVGAFAAKPAVGTFKIKTAELEVVKKTAEEVFEDYVDDIYDHLDLRRQGLGKDIFKRAMVGYQNLKYTNKIATSKPIISIIDFSKSSKNRRLWVIDLKAKKLLYYTWVAHGRGSGMDIAESFSNEEGSFKSSVGFYVARNTYIGKHGLSLKLDGLDAGFNSNANSRAIVVHGADYVSKSFIEQQGRAGRSHGCPALPVELTQPIIAKIKNNTCLYIDGPVKNYTSVYLNKSLAVSRFAAENPTLMATL